MKKTKTEQLQFDSAEVWDYGIRLNLIDDERRRVIDLELTRENITKLQAQLGKVAARKEDDEQVGYINKQLAERIPNNLEKPHHNFFSCNGGQRIIRKGTEMS